MDLIKFFGGANISKEKSSQLAKMQERLGVKPTQQSNNIDLVVALVIDATSSMSDVWQEVKSKIKTLINRQRELAPKSKLLIIAYRDYSDGNNIIQQFPPSENVEELLLFLDSISCYGGGDYPEAVEVALEKVLEVMPNMAIIVGDAPPHGVMDEFVQQKDYRIFSKELGRKKVPIFSVSTNNEESLVSSFSQISKLSGGKPFNIDEIDELVDVLSVATAQKIGSLKKLFEIFKRENGGKLTQKQEQLFLQEVNM